MSQPTNAPVAMDQRTFGRMFLGRQPGDRVSGKQLENDTKQYEYFVKKSVDEYFKSQQGAAPDRPVGVGYITNAPRVTMETNAAGNVITNTNSGPIVHQVEKFADGTFRIIPQAVHNFRAGSAEMVAPGTSRTITNETTGAPEMNYSSEYDTGSGAPAPTVGGGRFGATNATTPTVTPTPTPSPTPSFVVEATPDEIRQRYPNAPANLVPGMTIRLKSGGVIVVK